MQPCGDAAMDKRTGREGGYAGSYAGNYAGNGEQGGQAAALPAMGLSYQTTSWLAKAAVPPGPPEQALGMRRFTEPAFKMQSLKVQVVDLLTGSPDTALVGGLLLEAEFPSNFIGDGPFARDLHVKCLEANVPGAYDAELVVLESWGGAQQVITRAHVLQPMDSLRHFGGGDGPIQIQLCRRDGIPRCCCGLEICPRNKGMAARGASMLTGWLPSVQRGTGPSSAVLLRAAYPQYNSACLSCRKICDWKACSMYSQMAKRDEHCQECGHITYHNDVSENSQ